MKREVAEEVLKKNSKVIFEYFDKFMEDVSVISGIVNFYSENSKLVVDIEISEDGRVVFGTGFNMGTSAVYADILTREISEYLLETYLPSDNYGVSEYAMIKDHPTHSRDGFYIFNSHGSRVVINFRAQGEDFKNIMLEHNKVIEEKREREKTIKR